jgi:hypothetical protein
LLVHLIMNTPLPVIINPTAEPTNQQFICAQDLLKCLERKRGERELNNEHWAILQQMIRTREMEERYADGAIGEFSRHRRAFCIIDVVRW